MPRSSEPFSVPDGLDDAWAEMVRQNRILQAQNFGNPSGDTAPALAQGPPQSRPASYDELLSLDDLPAGDWRAARDAQARGVPWDQFGTNRLVQLSAADPATVSPVVVHPPSAPPPSQGPLTGRRGVAAVITGALNRIATTPNSSAPFESEGGAAHGVITRDSGRGLTAGGAFGPVHVGAEGTLDPPSGKAEISVSALQGHGVKLPPRIRIYNTPTGELDYDLPGPIQLGPLTIMKPGTYVIGQKDPAARRP